MVYKKGHVPASKTHGMSKTRIYKCWKDMKARCFYKKNKEFHNYGGRGISVCSDWENSFENFYRDMEDGYEDSLKLDRVDNNKGYSKGNCRWATQKEQGNNMRRNIYFKYKGKSYTIRQLSDISGIKYKTLRSRIIALKWKTEEAMSIKPVKGRVSKDQIF